MRTSNDAKTVPVAAVLIELVQTLQRLKHVSETYAKLMVLSLVSNVVEKEVNN